MDVSYTFSFESIIRGYHEYRMIWNNPITGEEMDFPSVECSELDEKEAPTGSLKIT